MRNHKTTWIELVVCVAAFVLVTVLSDHFQTRITFHDGQGWDGAYYYKVAEQVARGESIHAESPYVYRVGLPILAAMVNKADLLSGFKQVNLAINVLILGLFMLWLRVFLKDWRIRCVLTLLLLTQWMGPFRFISFYPATTDNPQYLFLLLGFIGIHVARSRELLGTTLVALAVFIGVFFRETVAVVGLAMIFLSNPIRFNGIVGNLVDLRFGEVLRPPKLLHYVPMIAGICALVCTHLMVHKVDDGYSFSRTAIHWIYDKPWLTYVHAVFIIFGPAIVLVIFNWRKSWAFLESNQSFLAFIAAACALAYIGGSDTERYLYMTIFPVYILIGKAIEDQHLVLQSKPLLLALCLSQLLAQRLFWTIPDFPNDYHTPLPVLTPLSNNFQYVDLYSYYGKRSVEAVSVAEYLVLSVVLIWWLSNRARRIAASPTPPGGPRPE
jgi:hypothetical protein